MRTDKRSLIREIAAIPRRSSARATAWTARPADAALVVQVHCGVGLMTSHWMLSSAGIPNIPRRQLAEPLAADVAAIQREGAEVVTKVSGFQQPGR